MYLSLSCFHVRPESHMGYLEIEEQITSIAHLSHQPIISGVFILQETIFDELQQEVFDNDCSTFSQFDQESYRESLSKGLLDCQQGPVVSNLTPQSRPSLFFHSQPIKGLLLIVTLLSLSGCLFLELGQQLLLEPFLEEEHPD